MIEWLQSPIVYWEEPHFRKMMMRISHRYCSFDKLYNAYKGMACGNYREYLQGDTVWLKKYLYVLRPLLACDWIEEKESFPPVLFDELLAFAKPQHAEMVREAQELLALKRKGLEKDFGTRLKALDRYIEEALHKDYRRVEYIEPIDKKELDAFFLRCVKGET